MYDVDGLGINLVVVHILRLRDVIHSRHTAGDSDILTAVFLGGYGSRVLSDTTGQRSHIDGADR